MLFFSTATPPPAIYPLSLHDALPICFIVQLGVDGDEPIVADEQLLGAAHQAERHRQHAIADMKRLAGACSHPADDLVQRDRKSTRLNSSHRCISYAVFCLKKKTTPHL